MTISMKILCLCIPGRGRFDIMAPLAMQLQRDGHQVKFVAPSGFASTVRQAGFEVLTGGLDIAELNARVDAAQGATPLSPSERAVQMFTGIHPQALLEQVLPQLVAWTPQLVLHEEGEFSAPLLAAICGARCVTLGWPVAMRPFPILQGVTGALDPLWRRYRQAPRRFGGLYQYFIDTCPPSLQNPFAAELRPSCLMRPVAPPAGPAGPAEDALLARIGGQGAIYITLGTVDEYSKAPALVHTLLDALSALGRTLVLTAGAGIEARFAQLPNLVVASFLPHDRLLPRCSLVVCHGGAGTTMGALSHGLPLLIIPRGGASQHRNAYQCAKYGSAIHLAEPDVTPELLRQHVSALLEQPSYRAAARRLQLEIEAMPDVASVSRKLLNETSSLARNPDDPQPVRA